MHSLHIKPLDQVNNFELEIVEDLSAFVTTVSRAVVTNVPTVLN